MSKSVVQETVVKLGTQIDNSGMQQLLGYLDTSKLKALGLTAAISALTTAIYKFASATVKQEFELQKLSKAKHRAVEDINAENKALSAMNMTLKEINKDSALKAIYKDIVAFNKELELPNVDNALKKVREMQGAFWKLKSAVNYAVESIGRKVLINLEAPMKRLTGYMNDASKWIKNNLNNITSKLGLVISNFAKGVFGIGEGVKKIFDWVGQMPSGIKAIASALLMVVGLMNSGPLGKILALVSLIGDIMHDYDVYKWNQEKGYTKGSEGYVGNLNDILGIWDIYDGPDVVDKKTKGERIADAVLSGFTEFLNNAWTTEAGQNSLGEFFFGKSGDEGLIGSIIKWFKTNQENGKLQELGTAFVKFITRSVQEVGGALGGAAGGLIEAILGGSGTVDEAIFKDKAAGATFAGTLGGALNGIIGQIKKGGKFHEVFLAGLGQGALGMIISAVLSSIQYNKDGSVDFGGTITKAIEAMKPVASTIVSVLCEAIKAVDDIGSLIFNAIADAIGGSTQEGTVEDQFTDPIENTFRILGNGMIGKAIFRGLTAGIASGNSTVGLFTGIISAIADAIANPEQFAKELDDLVRELTTFFSLVWQICWDGMEVTDETAPGGKKKVGGFLKKLILGDEENPEDLGIKGWFDDIWASVSGTVQGWIETIGAWLGDAIEEAVNGFLRAHPGLLWTITGGNPNTTEVTASGKDGLHTSYQTVTVTGTDGQTHTYTYDDRTGASGYSDSSIDFLERMSPYFVYNNGQIETNANTSSEMYESLRKYLSDSGFFNLLDRDPVYMYGDTYEGFIRYVLEHGLPSDSKGNLVDLSGWYESWNKEHPDKPLSSYIDPQVDLDALQKALDSRIFYINVKGNLESIKKYGLGGKGEDSDAPAEGNDREGEDSSEGGMFSAFGGRFGRRTNNLTVGEDGTEYIIPITKADRAASLINQMFNEMGASAVSRVISGLGLGQSGTNGSSVGALDSAISGMTMANTYNINAPVNINVNSTGADAKEIGTSIYDMAERHLIRNVMGVYG